MFFNLLKGIHCIFQASISIPAQSEVPPTKALQAAEILRLKTELANEKARTDGLQKELTSMKTSKSAGESRKPFAELSDRRQREVLSEINNTLEGSGYSVTSGVNAPEADVQKSFSYFYMQGVTEKQYKEAAKLPARKFF